jgi:hypothetical protein
VLMTWWISRSFLFLHNNLLKTIHSIIY